MESDWQGLVRRCHALLDRLEQTWGPVHAPDFRDVQAARWIRRSLWGGQLLPVHKPAVLALDALVGIEQQAELLLRNTRRFLAGEPANHALLWGARGTGKSSLVKAVCLGLPDLRLIEVDRDHLGDLPEIIARLADLPYHFVVFCDDLSFGFEEGGYRELKVVLDGSLGAAGDRVLVYATSNRRHLVAEPLSDNQGAQRFGEEIHPGEASDERLALAERFGLQLSFYPFDEQRYQEAVAGWLKVYGVEPQDAMLQEARQFARLRGGRSGRVANQFARSLMSDQDR